MDEPTQAQKLLSEVLGTAFLVFVGAGSVPATLILNKGTLGMADLGVISMAFATVIVGAVYALGHISGCHINPAVTIAFGAIGRIGRGKAALYIAAQLAGAVLASLAVVAIVGEAGDAGATAPRIGGWQAALWSELILTFFLVFVVFAVATDARAQGAFAAIAIGGYVGFAATGWGPVANASMNPARSFGPAVAVNTWEAHWVYWAGPIAGALLAAAVFELLREPHTPDPAVARELPAPPREGGSP